MKTLILLMLLPFMLSAQNTLEVVSSDVLLGEDIYPTIKLTNTDDFVGFQLEGY